ncbi:MAG: flagellar hook basal-body protein [Vampirovibrionales bacterium]|nr:flagellar hook basal-body protein [Vampirovibrionales bacterium]
MVLEGRLTYQGDGMSISTRAMNATTTLMNIHTDNIAHFGLPGYQRRTPVVTSFIEYLGANAVDKAVDTQVGRIRKSGNPLDVALFTQGYFQKRLPSGAVELTRDGRMRLDKDGFLLSLDGRPVLGANGAPIRFPLIPANPERDILINGSGDIRVYDEASTKTLDVGRLGVVQQDGSALSAIDVRQGHVEDSNVMLQNEFVSLLPLRRQFEANRQLFIMQSDTLSRTIQELGRPS